MRALVTGGYGFVGRHLSHHLVSCGDDVAMTYLPQKGGGAVEESSVAIPRTAQSLALDVTDRASVDQIVSLLKPDAIYHLAALTFVPEGEADPERAYSINMRGTFNVLDAVVTHSPESRVLVVTSSEVYGEPRPGGLPFTETSELRPVSAYGASKAAADVGAFKYFYRHGLHVVRVRPFQHIGPGQSEAFAIASFAKQVAAVMSGKQEPVVRVGNIEVRRDYSDVLDIVRGYREALLNGKPGEAYNLCSGSSVAVGDMLRMLVTLSEMSIEIAVDPERVRPNDIPDLCGSAQKAQRDFGWRPRIEREASLHSLLSHFTSG